MEKKTKRDETPRGGQRNDFLKHVLLSVRFIYLFFRQKAAKHEVYKREGESTVRSA